MLNKKNLFKISRIIGIKGMRRLFGQVIMVWISCTEDAGDTNSY